jgi:hypothetical protein
MTPAPETSASPLARRTARWVWLAVAGGFLLLALAWTALFVAADRVQTQFIPVKRAEGGR